MNWKVHVHDEFPAVKLRGDKLVLCCLIFTASSSNQLTVSFPYQNRYFTYSCQKVQNNSILVKVDT